MILWYMSVEKYFSLTPNLDTANKFTTVDDCLAEGWSAQNLWADATAEAIGLQERDEDGDLQEIGHTEDAFDQAVLRFFKKCGMPEITGEDQKRYMQHCIKKCAELEPSQMITRLESINRYIRHIPCKAEYDDTRCTNWIRGSMAFTERELVAIITCMILRKWSQQMLNENLRPYSMELDALKEYLPGLQKQAVQEYHNSKKNEKKAVIKAVEQISTRRVNVVGQKVKLKSSALTALLT